MTRFAALVVALAAASTTPAFAEVEIGGIAGIHVFSEDNALGTPMQEADANSLANSALFGARLGVYFGMFGVEGEFGVIPSEPRDMIADITNITYRGQIVAQFRSGNPSNILVPFVFLGGGMFQVYDSANEDLIVKNKHAVPFVGAGVKYRAAGGWGIRLDGRVLAPPSSEPGSSRTVDIEGLLSIYKEFGRKEAPKKLEEPKDDDPDKDGIVGAADQCPQEAEDKDSFEDDNGCPDADNDGDGIADASDKCIAEAEDKDNFEDDNGCPDPDNDGDGVPDAADKCVDKPETKNGFEDEEGCPDEIPEKLAAFTGVIQGINFKVNSVELQATSNKTLDKAFAVLAEYKETKLEIQGHTDDQPLGRRSKFKDNTELSQGRAETVKAYFVKKGIDESRLTAKGYGDTAPVEDPKGLKGAKLNQARAKNRRVEFKLITAEGGGEATPPADKPAGDTPPVEPAEPKDGAKEPAKDGAKEPAKEPAPKK